MLLNTHTSKSYPLIMWFVCVCISWRSWM
jgi:hypothetical protein